MAIFADARNEEVPILCEVGIGKNTGEEWG